MLCDWDDAKDRANQAKHEGISFELAARVFEDARCLVYPDRIDEETGEQRWHAIGVVPMAPATPAVLLVVHVYREQADGKEFIRIVSARAAEKCEIRGYREEALD
jgi:uncharacterized DUF497 family protein